MKRSYSYSNKFLWLRNATKTRAHSKNKRRGVCVTCVSGTELHGVELFLRTSPSLAPDSHTICIRLLRDHKFLSRICPINALFKLKSLPLFFVLINKL
jgi:hypothetical protein